MRWQILDRRRGAGRVRAVLAAGWFWLLAAGVAVGQGPAGFVGLPESPEAVSGSLAGDAGASSSLGAAGGRRGRRVEVVTLYDRPIRPFAEYGMALKFGSLGAGFEVGTTLLRNWNLRAGANFIDYGRQGTTDGVDYSGELHFRSGQMSLDWFPRHGGFHISPGVLLFRSRVFAQAMVPGGGTYTSDGVVYTSNPADPVRGVGQIQYSRRVSPALTVGFGNIIPRGGKRWTIPVEVGVAYVGAGRVSAQIVGQACDADGCFDVATDPDSQVNLKENLFDVNETLKRVPIFPMLSVGVGYRF